MYCSGIPSQIVLSLLLEHPQQLNETLCCIHLFCWKYFLGFPNKQSGLLLLNRIHSFVLTNMGTCHKSDNSKKAVLRKSKQVERENLVFLLRIWYLAKNFCTTSKQKDIYNFCFYVYICCISKVYLLYIYYYK